MKPWEIELTDWKRILFGNAPPEFMIEVFFRTLIVYLLLLFIVRWLGKRMSGQLTITEMAVMLTLGAIVSVPMQTPDRGILQGIVILFCALAFQRGFSYLGSINERLEHLTQGKMSLLVKDGIMQLEEMKKNRISRQQLFADLRSKGVKHLGEIERVYLEASGIFSVFWFAESREGLSVLPHIDEPLANEQKKSSFGSIVCCYCGTVYNREAEHQACAACNKTEWTNAISNEL